jgi:hypothetical protein
MRRTPGKRANARSQWLDHVRQAREYEGGLAAYCRQAGISVRGLSYWRKKCGTVSAEAAVERHSAFIPVQVMAAESAVRGSGLPDAKWLADLIRHLAVDPGRSER